MDEDGEVNPSRLGDCEVCGSENAQYTCPRCELKTCSLNCVKIHKKELECNGERDKTGYVPLSKFSNLTLLSDYRFLEDVTRTVDTCRRNPLKRYTRFKRPLPPHLWKLRAAADKRKTALHFLPQHFTRHKANTTQLNFKSGIIFWKLELIFPQGDNIRIVLDGCSEDDRLSLVLSRLIDFEKCPDSYRHHLRFYHSTGLAGTEALLKAEFAKTSDSFFLLDLSLSLKENFKERVIVENPIVHVILRDRKDEYHILDQDMECYTNSQNATGNDRRDFVPFHFFDAISTDRDETLSKSEEAAQSIHSTALELKKYFAAGDSDDSDTDAKSKENVGRQLNTRTNRRSRFQLDIPDYNELVKQAL